MWDYGGGLQFARYSWDAAVALDSNLRPLDERARVPICRPGAPGEVFETAGLVIETSAIQFPARFRDFDDHWSSFLIDAAAR